MHASTNSQATRAPQNQQPSSKTLKGEVARALFRNPVTGPAVRTEGDKILYGNGLRMGRRVHIKDEKTRAGTTRRRFLQAYRVVVNGRRALSRVVRNGQGGLTVTAATGQAR